MLTHSYIADEFQKFIATGITDRVVGAEGRAAIATVQRWLGHQRTFHSGLVGPFLPGHEIAAFKALRAFRKAEAELDDLVDTLRASIAEFFADKPLVD